MNKLSLTFLTLIFILTANPLANGLVFKSTDSGVFVAIPEKSQDALIAHKDGREAMLLAVNFDLEDNSKAFWLLPIPGKPEQVRVDVIDNFPRFLGMDPVRLTKEKLLHYLCGFQIVSQIYTWPLAPYLGTLKIIDDASINVKLGVEEHGLKVETLSSESASSLSLYLKNKGIEIAEPELRVLSDYFNEQYTLVFVEIPSRKELLQEFPDYEKIRKTSPNRCPAISIEFPSEKIFFPLKPTSTCKGDIAISLKILGLVKNEVPLSSCWHSKHYLKMHSISEVLPDAFAFYTPKRPRYYTHYDFHGNARELTEDMWMSPFEPKGLKYARLVDSIVKFKGGTALAVLATVFFLLQSWTCAGLAGLILSRKWNPYALFGFGNILTIIGVSFLARRGNGFLETPLHSDKTPKSFRLYRYGKKGRKRLYFLCLFSLLLTSSSAILYLLFTLPLYLQ